MQPYPKSDDHKYSLNTLDIKAKLYTRKLHTWKAWAGSMQGETRLNIPIWYYRLYNIIWHRLFYFIVHYSNPLHSNKSSKWPQPKIFCHYCSIMHFLDHQILQTDANRNHKCHNFDEYRLKAVSSGILSDWVYFSWKWKWLWASEESLNRSDRCIQYFKNNL